MPSAEIRSVDSSGLYLFNCSKDGREKISSIYKVRLLLWNTKEKTKKIVTIDVGIKNCKKIPYHEKKCFLII